MQLGRYEILKQLATSDVADVLLARATGLEGFTRHVVIKRIQPQLAGEQRFVRAFLDEARIAGTLHHQNIVQVHDVGEQDGSYFFAMEYVHGEDVRRLLAVIRERAIEMPLDPIVTIVSATAAGLHHAHEQLSPTGEQLELVHRDVSPANILIGYDGGVKLVDFGLAKARLRSSTTASGSLKGKASYMSPEQCKGVPVDRRTDTFALGIVLYELVTGRRLFKGANEYTTMSAVVDGQIPPPSAVRAGLPPELEAIMLKALERTIEARYQTAEELRSALEAFAREHELRTSSKALADYMVLLFGERPEPWHDPGGGATPADLETSTFGLAVAPADAGPEDAATMIAPPPIFDELAADEPAPGVAAPAAGIAEGPTATGVYIGPPAPVDAGRLAAFRDTVGTTVRGVSSRLGRLSREASSRLVERYRALPEAQRKPVLVGAGVLVFLVLVLVIRACA